MNQNGKKNTSGTMAWHRIAAESKVHWCCWHCRTRRWQRCRWPWRLESMAPQLPQETKDLQVLLALSPALTAALWETIPARRQVAVTAAKDVRSAGAAGSLARPAGDLAPPLPQEM